MKPVRTAKRQKLLADFMQAVREEVRLSIGWSDTAAELTGMHPTDVLAITFLNDAGEATAGELAKITGLSTGATTAAIDRLERAGFAVRKLDSRDRRKVVVKAVKLPSQLMALRTSARKELEDALSSYSDAELLRFIKLKNIMSDLLRKGIDASRSKRVRSLMRKHIASP